MTQLRTAVAARLPIKSALGYMVPNDQPPKKVLRSKFCKELFFLKRFFFYLLHWHYLVHITHNVCLWEIQRKRIRTTVRKEESSEYFLRIQIFFLLHVMSF